MSEKILIKKYENRRLYSVAEKRYVSLEEIRKLVAAGHDVEVIDHKSGEDITHQILFQVLLETESDKISTLPVFFLKFLISSSPAMLTDYFGSFFENQLSLYQGNREEYQRFLNQFSESFLNFNPGAFPNPFASLMNQNPFFTTGKKSKPEPEKKPEPPAEPLPADDVDDDDDVNELRDMLKKLSKKVDKLEKKKKR
ncbi:MAG: polyhydroxyalkanoate synthesis regulator DNA-binding domain-containing protein [Candidatus Wallbacteria bacterium]|nr:polyhydroxyalkanoate synthesis regulator DNA-binding domain-containing protein [Candidatus Wallbacteria bacterium]